LALTGFLAEEGSDGSRLRAGWFIERPSEGSDAPVDRFVAWLRDAEARAADTRLHAGVEMLVRDSALAGVGVAKLLDRAAECAREISDPWREEITRLVAELEEAGGPPPQRGQGTPAQLSIDRQLRRLR